MRQAAALLARHRRVAGPASPPCWPGIAAALVVGVAVAPAARVYSRG